MTVVPIDAPGGEHPFCKAILPGAAHVVHDLVGAFLGDRPAHPGRDIIEGLVPADPHPPARPPASGALERVEDPVGVGNLVERGGALGAVASARSRVLGVPLELAHLQGVPVHIREEPAGGFAVEAGRGDEHVPLLHPRRPGLGVELHPLVPPLLGWEGREVDPARAGVERLSPGFRRLSRGAHQSVELLELHAILPRPVGRPAPPGRRCVRRPAGRPRPGGRRPGPPMCPATGRRSPRRGRTRAAPACSA